MYDMLVLCRFPLTANPNIDEMFLKWRKTPLTQESCVTRTKVDKWKQTKMKCTYSRSIVNGNRFMAVASIDGIGWCNPNCYHITAAMMFTFSAIGQWTWIANLWFSFFPLRPSNIMLATAMKRFPLTIERE
jgi:hypothetical protein